MFFLWTTGLLRPMANTLIQTCVNLGVSAWVTCLPTNLEELISDAHNPYKLGALVHLIWKQSCGKMDNGYKRILRCSWARHHLKDSGRQELLLELDVWLLHVCHDMCVPLYIHTQTHRHTDTNTHIYYTHTHTHTSLEWIS